MGNQKKTGIIKWAPLWGDESNLMLQCHGPNRGISPEIIGALFLLVSYFMTPEQTFSGGTERWTKAPKTPQFSWRFFFWGGTEGRWENNSLQRQRQIL